MGSLKLRLWIAGGYLIVITLAIATTGIVLLFQWLLEQQAVEDMELQFSQLVAEMVVDQNGQLLLRQQPVDPHLSQIDSRLFWQISDAEGRVLLRSQTLTNDTIELPEHFGDGLNVHRALPGGPNESGLLVIEGFVPLPDGFDPHLVRVAIGYDRTLIDARLDVIVSIVLEYIGILALVLIVGGYLQVAFGLKPVMRIRNEIAQIRAGNRDQLNERYPEELQPLADELNGLLDAQQINLEKARSRAGDLAHGFKTQLAVLSSEIRNLREAGDHPSAERIEQVADAMQRQVEREVTRARANALALSRNIRTDIAPVIRKLQAALARTPRGEEIPVTIETPAELNVAMDQQDFLEVLGNVLENALKWAKSAVRISADRQQSEIVLNVSDDGPGIPDEKREQVLQRGVRLDMRTPGTGLGLDIVSELVTAYGGRIRLAESDEGGLLVELALPAA